MSTKWVLTVLTEKKKKKNIFDDIMPYIDVFAR